MPLAGALAGKRGRLAAPAGGAVVAGGDCASDAPASTWFEEGGDFEAEAPAAAVAPSEPGLRVIPDASPPVTVLCAIAKAADIDNTAAIINVLI